MGYGSRVRRVPARGGASLSDIDIYKVALIGRMERGFEGLIQREIYSMSDFYAKCGGFNSGFYSAYVAQSFFDELEKEVQCEMKCLGYVASDAVQASYSIMDQASSPVKIFDIYAGRKSVADKSAFGNKIGIKITHINSITMKLTSNVTSSDTVAYLDSVDNLEAGNYITLFNGTNTEVKKILTVVPSTKAITFSAVTNSFTAALTTITRQDWKLDIYIKDDLGNYQKIKTWEGPFVQSNTVGLAKDINDVDVGDDYVYIAVNALNTSDPDKQRPAALTTITPLTGGSDGSSPSDAQLLALANSYFASEEFTIMLSPESSSTTHAVNFTEFCTDGYKGMYYAQASNGAEAATLQNYGALCRGGVKFGMMPSDKWIRVNDPTVVNGHKDIPKVGIDAAHWFNTYAKYGESKVAAGNKEAMVLNASGKLLDSNGLVHDDPEGVGSRLIKNYSINICRFKRGKGITNNSARTFSTDKGYIYQNQIMQWILYARSILAYLQEIEQDKAGFGSQEIHYNAVWAYMKGKYDAGHLFIGQKEDGSITTFQDVCMIVNDFTINTLVNISNGIEETFLQFVAPPPIEEAILSLASAAVTTVKA